MKRRSCLPHLMLGLLCCASAQAQTAAPAPFSLAGSYRATAAMLGFERQGIDADAWRARAALWATEDLRLSARYAEHERGASVALTESKTAWVVGANYSLASGSVLVGYGRMAPGGSTTMRQFSIGYEYPLTRRLTLFADMADKKSGMRIRHVDLGIQAAF